MKLAWIVKPISNLLGIGENLTDPTQYNIKKIKRLEYRIEAAMNYIFVIEKSGQYSNINEDKQKAFLLHFRKRIFDSQ